MWAGGKIQTHGRLRFRVPTTRRSQVLDTVEKTGRSGSLTFVTVGHQIIQDGEVVVDEQQDVLYRPEPEETAKDRRSPAESPAAPGSTDAVDDEWQIDPPLLFRHSALTYNGHRIHYERDYARDLEGYLGLLVHGPLQATCMAEVARQGAPR